MWGQCSKKCPQTLAQNPCVSKGTEREKPGTPTPPVSVSGASTPWLPRSESLTGRWWAAKRRASLPISDGRRGGKRQLLIWIHPRQGVTCLGLSQISSWRLGSLRDAGKGVSRYRHRGEKSRAPEDSPPCPASPQGPGRPLLGRPSLSARCRSRAEGTVPSQRPPDPQRPGWGDASRATRPRHPWSHGAAPQCPGPPRRNPEPAARPASAQPYRHPSPHRLPQPLAPGAAFGAEAPSPGFPL